MKRLQVTVRNSGLSLSSIGASFSQPDFWSVPSVLSSTPTGPYEPIPEADWPVLVERTLRQNGVVATTILIRQMILSEARFQYQRIRGGRPGDLFSGPALRRLEQPWPNGTTGELIARMEQDASTAGNFYAALVSDDAGDRFRRMRPDWVTIVTLTPNRPDGSPGSPWDLYARPGGYIYRPPGEDPVLLDPSQVVHYSPIPDPLAQWRGMSWLTPILRDVESDDAASRHKLKFFRNGATSNHFVTYDPDTSVETVTAFAELFAEQHHGVDNAYKTIHLGGGADIKSLGADLRQLDFKMTQGAGESRIAAMSLVGAVLAMFSEGMQGSSLNAGNFNAAKRRFANVGARPLWRSMAASLAHTVEVPEDARLWYDDRDIPFLQDDAKDRADVLHTNAQAIAALARDGFKPESAVAAITSGDLRMLEHTGLPSVQVQPAQGE